MRSHKTGGSCPCTLEASVDASGARFGYPATNRPVAGGVWREETDAGGATKSFAVLPRVPLTLADGSSVVFDGSSLAFTVAGPSGRLADITAGERRPVEARPDLAVRTPFSAEVIQVATDAHLAHVDRDGDSKVDKTVAVRWEDLRSP